VKFFLILRHQCCDLGIWNYSPEPSQPTPLHFSPDDSFDEYYIATDYEPSAYVIFGQLVESDLGCMVLWRMWLVWWMKSPRRHIHTSQYAAFTEDLKNVACSALARVSEGYPACIPCIPLKTSFASKYEISPVDYLLSIGNLRVILASAPGDSFARYLLPCNSS
jgi:hypothetical protein